MNVPHLTTEHSEGGLLGPHLLDQKLQHAFQPIVDIHTGVVHAHEALLRGTEDAGFSSIQAFFDASYQEGVLDNVELALARRALEKLERLPGSGMHRLFFNIDGRTLEHPSFRVDSLIKLLHDKGVEPNALCIEISEQHKTARSSSATMAIAALRANRVRIALDDFGQGFSELTLLYTFQPEYVKIDRFFVADIARSHRKKLFVSTIVNLAHVLGAKVIAEGVETAEELVACRQVGCDFAQGFFVARPAIQPELLSVEQRHVLKVSTQERRTRHADESSVRLELKPVEPILSNMPMAKVFERFRQAPDRPYFPVLNLDGEPEGLLHERDLRSYVFSPTGRDLLQNSNFANRLMAFITRCPIIEVTTPVERILESYANSFEPEAVIVTENGQYLGILSSTSILKLVNEKRLTVAQDQNPLTRLPGNQSINNHLVDAAEPYGQNRIFCYFDFNHFKPFNDQYGFRQGDRAIMLFADILRRYLHGEDVFLGHIGGDDFFAGLRNMDADRAMAIAKRVTDSFRDEITSFYASGDRERGYLLGLDREGHEQIYPLMTCSVALVEVGAAEVIDDFVALSKRIADAKRAAKLAPDAVAIRRAPSYLSGRA
ncbi:putative cyclic di-GMP phosphodiesterase YliE [Hartmannibacter diazotrophicus]|uniref:Putative cyclic di-GMP phosphodiesterase YliE n=1 Tax=Hartmannibacter diazotrophicus TaxID=1482074 RepID=A0A2C9D723_9HYPH|nr:GGDEF domain-containing protein [Hartmannibacter diazotrophicus]SON56124.1 putative cyclic di-GMP phosphodiesterase YliE [Hartmannibacter diazotrophicus]